MWRRLERMALRATHGTFGDAVTFYPNGPDPEVIAAAVFDRAYGVIETTGEGPPITTTRPAIHVEAAKFKRYPKQGDAVRAEGETWEVRDVQPDSFGGVTCILRLWE